MNKDSYKDVAIRMLNGLGLGVNSIYSNMHVMKLNSLFNTDAFKEVSAATDDTFVPHIVEGDTFDVVYACDGGNKVLKVDIKIHS